VVTGSRGRFESCAALRPAFAVRLIGGKQPIGSGATPASVAQAADTTLLVAAGLAALATASLVLPWSSTAAIPVASWPSRIRIAWSTRHA
jgi:hypothetical protein